MIRSVVKVSRRCVICFIVKIFSSAIERVGAFVYTGLSFNY